MTLAPPAVHLHQIAWSPSTRSQIQPGWTVLDNTANPRPDWFEYWPIRRFLIDEALDDDAFYGFFSPKFTAKTGLDAAQVRSFVAGSASSADVVLFSPQPDMGGLFFNVFEQAETFDAGFIDAYEDFLRSIGQHRPLRTIPMDARQTVFSNYFVARPAFWRAWLAVNEALFAACESADATPLRQRLTAPTSYHGAHRKVFMMERTASLLLATDPRWRSRAHDPYGMAWSATRLREFPLEAAIADALKMAWRDQGFPIYQRAYAAMRQRFAGGAPPLGTVTPPATAEDPAAAPNAAPAAAPGTTAVAAPAASAAVVAAAAAPAVPVLVISYNNHVFVAHTVAQLRALGVDDIVVVDNCSTRRETRDWLDSVRPTLRVVDNPANWGHLCWARPEIYDSLPDRFCVTDPDLAFNPRLPRDFIAVLGRVADRHGAMKVGFALDLSDADAMHDDPDYHRGLGIVAWERQFWQHRLPDADLDLYRAGIDTTFHLFDKRGSAAMQIRVAGAYTARHLPWYRDNPVADADEMTRMYAAAGSVSTMARLHLRLQAKRTVDAATAA